MFGKVKILNTRKQYRGDDLTHLYFDVEVYDDKGALFNTTTFGFSSAFTDLSDKEGIEVSIKNAGLAMFDDGDTGKVSEVKEVKDDNYLNTSEIT